MSAKTIEIEGKSIDDAIETACREFGVPREKLNIEIISETGGGFLGISKKAKIRASLLSLDMSFELNDEVPVRSEPVRSESKLKISAKPQQEIREEKPAPAMDNSELVLKASELLSGILQRMSFDCQVTASETPDKIILNIEGDASGLLIGKRGQNLDAIQYILNKAINRADNDRKKIVVDSEAYRKRREESLLSLAEKIRDKVKKTKKPVSLSHMNAHDRRIIHMALQEDEALVTKSRGEGDYRKIVILPARRANKSDQKTKDQV
jgi:spoIIIJ-associated protein